MITAASIDALLPQTQCNECGYQGCMAYAQAIKKGAPINKCTPGGKNTLEALAKHLNITQSLQPPAIKLPTIAVIKEQECIGCTKCIQACPVDAIVGASKQMHTIIAHECTGCNLCVEPCPVDCIEIQSIPKASFDKEKSRERFRLRKIRLKNLEELKNQQLKAKQDNVKKNYILAALKRVNDKKNES